MILDDTLLHSPANWRTADDLHILETTQNGWTATLTASAVDTIGARLWEVAATREGDAVADLKALAERVSGRVTCLLEPLRVLEVDTEQGLAVCRSQEPTTKQDQKYYSELSLHQDGGMELRRYRAATPGQRREQVPFALTHEALAKLVHDLTR